MTETNFDRHLAKYLDRPEFAERFRRASEEWDVALQLAKLRQDAGLSQAQLARKLNTSQQQISRLESANYEGHSLSMLRRIAKALDARVVVSLIPNESDFQVNEAKTDYNSRNRQKSSKREAIKKTAKKRIRSANSRTAKTATKKVAKKQIPKNKN